jgi:hypothetical protein
MPTGTIDWRGGWAGTSSIGYTGTSTITYYPMDAVYYDGTSYIATGTAAIGSPVPPVDLGPTGHWDRLAIGFPGNGLSQMAGLYTQTVNGPTANSNVETSIIGAGNGTLSIPANGFRVGDTFTCKAAGHISSANNDLRLRVKADSVSLADTGMFNYNTSGSELTFDLELTFVIRNVGGTGTAEILTKGFLRTIKNSNLSVNGYSFEYTNNTTFNTTIANTLDITVQWDQNVPTDIFYTDILVLNKVF